MKVGLGLGSNVGDRLQHLQLAKQFLLNLSPARHHASPVYETVPVNCPPNSPAFLNAVVEIDFTGTPQTLLNQTLAYEAAHGRDRFAGVNAPRTIDIDVLYFGDQEVCEDRLIIPHPRLAERRFVLVPLATICPDMIVKGTGQTVRSLLRELPERGEEVKLVQQDW